MKREDFTGFTPDINTPLVVSFVQHLREQGYSTQFSFDFWDFYSYESSDSPVLCLKTVRNSLSDAVMERVLVEKTPLKVLLVEGSNPNFKNFEARKLFLASTGTGLYVRNVGWLVTPARPAAETVEDLQLKLAPRWRRSEDGTWLKMCTKCGIERTTREFYRSNYATSRDPYRHHCVYCFGKKPAPDANQA